MYKELCKKGYYMKCEDYVTIKNEVNVVVNKIDSVHK